MDQTTPSEESIFELARQKSSKERAAYLDEACGQDTHLRKGIEKLLEAASKAGTGFLESAPPDLTEDLADEEPGQRIGPYTLINKRGEGTFGTVYEAEQKAPVRRRVAMKILKDGMNTKEVIARFEAERQALAVMDHPCIAKVFDAGTTNSGRPYFVMEFVPGGPITEYCDARQLTPKERLAMFLEVCQAVQHAHRKGIIHRDLKPQNILVAEYDQKAIPKVIDFGIAKATTQSLTEKTLHTHVGQIIGTLQYMSPEQAKLDQLDVDTRSDVYSLGVILYELLTGVPPLERERIKTAGIDELLRLIREEEPPKPSSRIDELAKSTSMTSVGERSSSHTMRRFVRGDLDWIVMKSLEKDAIVATNRPTDSRKTSIGILPTSPSSLAHLR